MSLPQNSEMSADNLSSHTLPDARPSSPENSASNWRQSKWLAVAELIVVALIFYADFKHHIYFSKTSYLLLFGWLSLRVRKLRWRDVGLNRFRNWKTTIALGIVAGVLLGCFELFVSQALLVQFLHKQPDLEVFHNLNGNLKMTLFFIA